MFPKLALSVACALVFAGAGQAQEVFTIKLKKETKGTSTNHVKNVTSLEHTKITDSKAKVLQEEKKESAASEAYEQTILEKPDPKKPATALNRTYKKAVLTVDKMEKALPFQGKAVKIEKKDGPYRFYYQGGAEITGEDAAYLDREFNKDQADSDFDIEEKLLPGKAVKVGESWKVPVQEIAKEFEKIMPMGFDASKATGTGKLLKAFKKDGRQHGDLTYRLEFPTLAVKTPQGEVKFMPGAALVMDITLSTCIDGTALDGNSTLNITFNGVAMIPGQELVLNLAQRTTIAGTVVEVTKKK
jgi:hypothetical protein